jgi:NADH-quinone oxidoreductase subunit C
MSQQVVKKLQERFGDKVLHTHAQCGDDTVVLDRSALHAACLFLKADPALRFDLPIDVTAVDFQGYPGERKVPYGGRFEVVYHLYSTTTKQRIRLKVPLTAEEPVVDSVTDVWRGVDWFERETFDMFGVRFEGHPNLKRILLYEEFVGHPLRKDYPRRGYQPRMPMPRLRGDRVPGVIGAEEDL